MARFDPLFTVLDGTAKRTMEVVDAMIQKN